MDKLKIILDLVRKGAITDEQAQALLHTEKEYIYRDVYHPRTYSWPWTYPYYQPTITYTSGSSFANNAILTTTTSNNCSDINCGCTSEDCEPKQATA